MTFAASIADLMGGVRRDWRYGSGEAAGTVPRFEV